jgi:hypothetical protein
MLYKVKHLNTLLRAFAILLIFPTTLLASHSGGDPKSRNTWVTGLIFDQNGKLIGDNLDIKIFVKGEQVATMTAQYGFFKANLGHLFSPEDTLELIMSDTLSPRLSWYLVADDSLSIQSLFPSDGYAKVALKDAQNVTITTYRFDFERSIPACKCIRPHYEDIQSIKPQPLKRKQG